MTIRQIGLDSYFGFKERVSCEWWQRCISLLINVYLLSSKSLELRWMLIYDNVESPDVLNLFWPVSKRGTILITSRKHVFAMQPAKGGLEILPFEIPTGAKYILRCLGATIADPEPMNATDFVTKTAIMNKEEIAATKLSEMMGGQPLALTQIVALGFKNWWNAHRLLSIYEKYPRKVREKINPELLHAGYSLSMTTVFQFSFQALTPEAFTILAIMSFFQPEGISEEIFNPEKALNLPSSLEFLHNEFM